MPASKSRAFRPALDRLDPLCLLSAGLAHPAAIVHVLKTVDLKSSPAGAALSQVVSTAAGGVQANLDSVTVSQKGRAPAKVAGQFSVFDPLVTKGPTTVVVKFTSPLEHARPKKVMLNLGRLAPQVSKAQKLQVQAALAGFVTQYHDPIAAALKTG